VTIGPGLDAAVERYKMNTTRQRLWLAGKTLLTLALVSAASAVVVPNLYDSRLGFTPSSFRVGMPVGAVACLGYPRLLRMVLEMTPSPNQSCRPTLEGRSGVLPMALVGRGCTLVR
jgi:hypothetical protein